MEAWTNCLLSFVFMAVLSVGSWDTDRFRAASPDLVAVAQSSRTINLFPLCLPLKSVSIVVGNGHMLPMTTPDEVADAIC